jgi:coenzyme F420-0:L-glutamate ligase/coenzyme F420-1:gamma-L-glutamate ligase
MSERLEIIALAGLPEVADGDRLGELIASAAAETGVELADGEIVVVSQKIVSKAEGRVRDLAAVEPGERAVELGAEIGRDPRLVELILGESKRIVRATEAVLIVETHGGWVCANAGIDASNLPGEHSVALLPLDADASARRIRGEIAAAGGGARPAVVIADSFGRPWRLGQTEVAIGCAGLAPLDDWSGRPDAHGRELAATSIAVADQLAGAADLARAKDSAQPAVVIRGAERLWTSGEGAGAAAALQRPAVDDLFR